MTPAAHKALASAPGPTAGPTCSRHLQPPRWGSHPTSCPSTPSSPRHLPFLPATKASRLPGLVLSSPHSTSLCTICSSNNLSGDQPLSVQVTFKPQHTHFLLQPLHSILSFIATEFLKGNSDRFQNCHQEQPCAF